MPPPTTRLWARAITQFLYLLRVIYFEKKTGALLRFSRALAQYWGGSQVVISTFLSMVILTQLSFSLTHQIHIACESTGLKHSVQNDCAMDDRQTEDRVSISVLRARAQFKFLFYSYLAHKVKHLGCNVFHCCL